MKNPFRHKANHWFILFAGWIVTILLINPIGNFPLNDDWAYAKSVQELLSTGKLHLLNWGEMTLISHVYWGYLFSLAGEFSHTALRISTLVLGFAYLLTCFALSLKFISSTKNALASSLTMAANPLFICLSFTFMTDVPFAVFLLLSYFFFLNSEDKSDTRFLLGGTLACLVALFYRQLAFVIPISWLLAFILSRTFSFKSLLKSIAPLLIMLLVYVGYTVLMREYGLLQNRFNDKLSVLSETLLHFSAKNALNSGGYTIIIISYCGLFLSPLLCLFLNQFSTKQLVVCLLAAFIFTTGFAFTNKLFPVLDNIWINFGVGPTTLSDYYGSFTSFPHFTLPYFLQLALTLISLFFGAVLTLVLVSNANSFWKKKNLDFTTIFTWSIILIYLSPFVLVGIYDRYLIPIVPLVFVLLFHSNKPKTQIQFSWKLLVPMASLIWLFSVLATHDYLSWNRARWKFLSQLENKETYTRKIQGGVEYDAWHYYADDNLRWYENIPIEYQLAFSYSTDSVLALDSILYSRWLPGENKIYLTKREIK